MVIGYLRLLTEVIDMPYYTIFSYNTYIFTDVVKIWRWGSCTVRIAQRKKLN